MADSVCRMYYIFCMNLSAKRVNASSLQWFFVSVCICVCARVYSQPIETITTSQNYLHTIISLLMYKISKFDFIKLKWVDDGFWDLLDGMTEGEMTMMMSLCVCIVQVPVLRTIDFGKLHCVDILLSHYRI